MNPIKEFAAFEGKVIRRNDAASVPERREKWH